METLVRHIAAGDFPTGRDIKWMPMGAQNHVDVRVSEVHDLKRPSTNKANFIRRIERENRMQCGSR